MAPAPAVLTMSYESRPNAGPEGQDGGGGAERLLQHRDDQGHRRVPLAANMTLNATQLQCHSANHHENFVSREFKQQKTLLLKDFTPSQETITIPGVVVASLGISDDQEVVQTLADLSSRK